MPASSKRKAKRFSRSVTSVVHKRIPLKTSRRRSWKEQRKSMKRGSLMHNKLSLLIGGVPLPPKCAKFLRRIEATFKEHKMRVVDTEVVLRHSSLSGRIDLLAKSTVHGGHYVIEVKTMNCNRSDFEAAVVREPKGTRALQLQRAKLQARLYAKYPPYQSAVPIALFVFNDSCSIFNCKRLSS